jgi:putative ABC transport system permease protein
VPFRTLAGLLVAEISLLALVSGLIGVALGYAMAAALLPDVAASLQGLYGAEVPGRLSLRPWWVLAGLAMSLLGAWVASASALWRVMRMPVLAPAMPRAWGRASQRHVRRTGLSGLALLALAAALTWLAGGLIPAFAAVACLFVGAALVLPWLLSAGLAAAAARSRSPLWQWFWADTGQQLPGLSLALMALLLALAANVGVGTMVASFRQTFAGWLDQRLASELYLTARSEAEAQTVLAALPDGAMALPIWSAETPLAGQPGDVFGIVDHATYRDHWPFLAAEPDVWARVTTGQAALVSEQLARRANLGLGDRLDLPGGDLPIAGIYSDYGNPRPQAIVAVAVLLDRFPDVPRLRYGLRVPPNDARALAANLRARFALSQGALVEQAEVKAFSLAVFERTFAVTGALNVLTLSVAGLALWASLLTLADLRLPQLAPVWAIGLRRSTLVRVEVFRILVLAMMTLAVALPLGLALGWLLLARINVEAFGWRLPMVAFPGQWAALALAALAAASLAAAWPAWRLWRMPAARLLKVFAHERG